MICIPARLVVCILYTQTRPEYTQTAYQEALPAASGVHSVPWKCLGSASTALSRVPHCSKPRRSKPAQYHRGGPTEHSPVWSDG